MKKKRYWFGMEKIIISIEISKSNKMKKNRSDNNIDEQLVSYMNRFQLLFVSHVS